MGLQISDLAVPRNQDERTGLLLASDLCVEEGIEAVETFGRKPDLLRWSRPRLLSVAIGSEADSCDCKRE